MIPIRPENVTGLVLVCFGLLLLLPSCFRLIIILIGIYLIVIGIRLMRR